MRSLTPRINAYLVASSFEETLAVTSCGLALSEHVGIPARVFEDKIAALDAQRLVQPGGELTYLLLHDPEYQALVRRENLMQAGKKVSLKRNVDQLVSLLASPIDISRFDFHVISSAPQELVEVALEGIVPTDHIHGTQLRYHFSGKIESAICVNTGYGKIVVVDRLRRVPPVAPTGVIYLGGSASDLHVMLYVNAGDGLTVAASLESCIAHIARYQVLSDDGLSLLAPILEEIVRWDAEQIRSFLEDQWGPPSGTLSKKSSG